MRTLLVGLVLFLAAGSFCSTPAQTPPIGVLRSPPTLEALGWRGEWEFSGALAALRRLGVEPAVLSPDELPGWEGRLLILPNVRNLAPETVEAVRAHTARGGKLLATYMSSYRRHDNSSWSPNNFALADVFGADFHRWVGAPPEAGALVVPGTVLLGRHQAMLVRPRPDARVLWEWDEPKGEPAVVESAAGVYVGEDLFAPENSESREVLLLLRALIERLAPGQTREPSPGVAPPPHPPFLEVPSSEESLSVGLGTVAYELRLRSPGGVEWGGRRAPEIHLRGTATVGKPPALALHSAGGELLERSPDPVDFVGAPYLEVLRENPNGTYSWSAYRGSLTVTATAEGFPPSGGRKGGISGLSLVNHLSLEAYLAGVVPSEVPAYFPPEALKAMAVVARTFALSHRKRHPGYDVCAEVHCQVYRGLSREAEATTHAIESTAGQTLACEDTPFHAVCGGAGEDASRAWERGGDLKGRLDVSVPYELKDAREFIDHPPECFCARAGRFRWEEAYEWKALPALLERGLGQELGELLALEVTERTPLGRAAVLTVRGSRGEHQVRGDRIRWLFSGGRVGGAGGLNSTLFYLRREGDRLRVVGGGWGHGVGLCQEGAAGRARAGQSYRSILEHYYPGADLGTSR